MDESDLISIFPPLPLTEVPVLTSTFPEAISAESVWISILPDASSPFCVFATILPLVPRLLNPLLTTTRSPNTEMSGVLNGATLPEALIAMEPPVPVLSSNDVAPVVKETPPDLDSEFPVSIEIEPPPDVDA